MILVDKENYILDGVLYTVPQVQAPLDMFSAERAVAYYKSRLIDSGRAFGKMDAPIIESEQSDMSMDEFIPYSLQDPIAAAQALSWDDDVYNEEVLNPNDATFQILEMLFDRESKSILGRIHLLNTASGRMARSFVDQGYKCLITKAEVDEVVDRDRTYANDFVWHQIVRKIRGGWRISFEQEETVKQEINK